jgi:hypothetical protein
MSETVRALYERSRRKKLAEERRRYQILFPWLEIMHSEIFSQFDLFFRRLSERNPRIKNLTTSEDFKYFLCQRKGVCLVFYFMLL